MYNSNRTFGDIPEESGDDYAQRLRSLARDETEVLLDRANDHTMRVEAAGTVRLCLALAKDFDDRQAAIDAAKLDEIRLLLQPIMDGCDIELTPREIASDVMAIVEGGR